MVPIPSSGRGVGNIAAGPFNATQLVFLPFVLRHPLV